MFIQMRALPNYDNLTVFDEATDYTDWVRSNPSVKLDRLGAHGKDAANHEYLSLDSINFHLKADAKVIALVVSDDYVEFYQVKQAKEIKHA